MRLRRKTPILVVAVLTVGTVACSDPIEPADPIVGAYEAVELVILEDGTPRDILADGAFIDLVIRRNGATDGEMFLPQVLEGEGRIDLRADLAGEWELSDSVLTLTHEADSFLRDAFLVFRGDSAIVGTATNVQTVTLVKK